MKFIFLVAVLQRSIYLVQFSIDLLYHYITDSTVLRLRLKVLCFTGYKCRTDNDEDLERSLNHDLSLPSYPPYPPPYAPSYAPWEYNPRSYR